VSLILPPEREGIPEPQGLGGGRGNDLTTSTAQSDKLDLPNLLSGHYDSVHDATTDFVSFATASGNTNVLVDLDGTVYEL
jgi:hypothetical protein